MKDNKSSQQDKEKDVQDGPALKTAGPEGEITAGSCKRLFICSSSFFPYLIHLWFLLCSIIIGRVHYQSLYSWLFLATKLLLKN